MILRCMSVEYCIVCTGTCTGTGTDIVVWGLPAIAIGTDIGMVMGTPGIDNGKPMSVYGIPGVEVAKYPVGYFKVVIGLDCG